MVDRLDPLGGEDNLSLGRVVLEAEVTGGGQRRRLVVLNEVFLAGPDHPVVTPRPSMAQNVGPRGPRLESSHWLAMAERLIGMWAPTLRAGLLLTILITVLSTLIVVGFGVGGALVVVSAGAAIKARCWMAKRHQRMALCRAEPAACPRRAVLAWCRLWSRVARTYS